MTARMPSFAFFAAAALALASGHGIWACTPILEERTLSQIRADSRAVEVGPNCAFTKGGIHDTLSAGEARDLGRGRVVQQLYAQPSAVLLGDCETREATILLGPVDASQPELPCGGFSRLPLQGQRAVHDLSAGEDLHGLVDLVVASGGVEQNPIRVFLRDPEDKPVPRRDFVDLLCGCKLHYPGSPGASR